MKDDMIELKKDSLRQMQSGDIKLGFTIQHNDMPDYLFSDPMGKRYYVVFIDADHYDETKGQSANSAQSSCPEIPDSSAGANNAPTQNEKQPSINEKSEGQTLLARAHCLCVDKEFLRYLDEGIHEYHDPDDADAAFYMYRCCDMKSRSELVTQFKAQEKFKQLDQKYRDWQFANRYEDNLNR